MSNCLIKICGIRQAHEAAYCEDIGVDFVGLNFVPSSSRFISVEKAKEICAGVDMIKKVGVFQDQPLEEVNRVAEEVGLDFIQLSGDEDLEYVKGCVRPVIKGISMKGVEDTEKAGEFLDDVEFVLFDGPKPGSGETFDWDVVKGFDGKFFVAGGINEDNVAKVIVEAKPMGVDTASGVETMGQIDLGKINSLVEEVKKVSS